MLAKLIGVEDRVWVQPQSCSRVYAIADEDLDRENEEKTSSVHFLRFEFAPAMRETILRGAQISIGVDHPAYSASIDSLDAPLADSLRQDLGT
jgi:hypothetical protein